MEPEPSETKKLEEIIKILNSINKTIEEILTSNNTSLDYTTLEYLFPDKEWPSVKDKNI